MSVLQQLAQMSNVHPFELEIVCPARSRSALLVLLSIVHPTLHIAYKVLFHVLLSSQDQTVAERTAMLL